jgi:hypothetical protein
MALLVKGVAGVYASSVQGQMGGEVGSDLRLRALDALLSVGCAVRDMAIRGSAPPASRHARALGADGARDTGAPRCNCATAPGVLWIFAMHRDRATRRADVVVRVDPYGATFFAPVTKYSVSAKHEEGTLLCCS